MVTLFQDSLSASRAFGGETLVKGQQEDCHALILGVLAAMPHYEGLHVRIEKRCLGKVCGSQNVRTTDVLLFFFSYYRYIYRHYDCDMCKYLYKHRLFECKIYIAVAMNMMNINVCHIHVHVPDEN